ncbi:unnamed protein product [Peronospora belbahrii]|uniref:Uncharacterized protein n=1 Tax=Peronospora belbahrii TaxID=622444 RepID=A0ABN8D037_9STRA|nr:unnamed protein product [Peronospora belbahrii]
MAVLFGKKKEGVTLRPRIRRSTPLMDHKEVALDYNHALIFWFQVQTCIQDSYNAATFLAPFLAWRELGLHMVIIVTPGAPVLHDQISVETA